MVIQKKSVKLICEERRVPSRDSTARGGAAGDGASSGSFKMRCSFHETQHNSTHFAESISA